MARCRRKMSTELWQPTLISMPDEQAETSLTFYSALQSCALFKNFKLVSYLEGGNLGSFLSFRTYWKIPTKVINSSLLPLRTSRKITPPKQGRRSGRAIT